MAGVKGRSGRRPIRDETKRFAVVDKAWRIIENYFDDPEVPQKEKVEQAVKICVRAIPSIDVTDFEDGGVLIQVNHNYNRPVISSTHVENTTVNQIEAEQVVVKEEPLIPQDLPRINLNHAN